MVEKPRQPRRGLVPIVEDCVFLPIQHAVVWTQLPCAVSATPINQLPLARVDPRQQAREHDGARQAIETVSMSGNYEASHAFIALAHGAGVCYCHAHAIVPAADTANNSPLDVSATPYRGGRGAEGLRLLTGAPRARWTRR